MKRPEYTRGSGGMVLCNGEPWFRIAESGLLTGDVLNRLTDRIVYLLNAHGFSHTLPERK